jgi:anti-sigma factor RsiW
MIIDEVILRAYVDGELSPEERGRVEAAVSNSAGLRKQVEALQASCLPYRAAFDAFTLPPIPEALTQQLAALSAVAQSGPSSVPTRPRRHWFLNAAGIGLGLAATFTAGVLLRPALLLNNDDDKVFGPWVHAIASYQALYVRETLERNADSAENVARVLQSFQTQVGQERKAWASQAASVNSGANTSFGVPDLGSVGLAFKRAQLLGFGERPLIQMAYLPSQGKPAALCVLPIVGRAESTAQGRRIENLSIVTWQKQGFSYVLALDMPLEKALVIGKKLFDQQYPALFEIS